MQNLILAMKMCMLEGNPYTFWASKIVSNQICNLSDVQLVRSQRQMLKPASHRNFLFPVVFGGLNIQFIERLKFGTFWPGSRPFSDRGEYN
jgi:hypothetical protein